MGNLVGVECPHCSEETVALTPEGTEPVGTAMNLDSTVPPGVDTAVRTTCPNDVEFVVYLRES